MLKEIVGDDEILKKVSKKLKELNSDSKVIGLYDIELEEEKIRRTQLKYAEDKKSREIAKNMLSENIDISIVSKVTGLPISKIQSLI